MVNLALSELKLFVEDDKLSEAHLKQLAVRLAQAQYQRLGWHTKDGESDEDTKLRSNVIAAMLYGDDPDAVASAIDLYQAAAVDDLEPELRPLIIGAVLRHTKDESIFVALIDKYRAAPAADLRDDIILGLAQTNNQAQIRQLLSFIPDARTVRPQDAIHWMAYIIKGRHGRALAWQWMRDNWDWIEKTFAGDKSYDMLPRLVGNVLRTRDEYNEYKTFFASMRDTPALARVISMGISDIEGRVSLLERDTTAVVRALRKL